MPREHDRQLYHRQSLRRPDHDYFGNGVYFVTVPTHENAELFGRVESDAIVLNDAARMIMLEWKALEERFENVSADMLVVMPDHVHGVLVLRRQNRVLKVDAPADAIAEPARPGVSRQPGYITQSAERRKDIGLSRVMQAFKSLTTLRYSDGVRNAAWQPYNRKIWHRNYFDRIVRNRDELDNIRDYIRNNPGKLIELADGSGDLQ